jgi:two-component system chemotaxis response regulator CheY
MQNLVLVVDDSPSVRKFVSFSLRLAGCKVIEAMDGQDGLEQLARHPETSLVVTDLNMPNMDGLSLIRALKESPGLCKVPVIILSSEQDEPVREESLKAGADAFLVKPFAPEVLQEAVRQLIGPMRKSA